MGRRELIDTHCHLNHEQFDVDLDAVIARAREAGVERLLVIGFDLASSRSALQVAMDNPDMQAVVGIHPESAREWSAECRSELLEMTKSHPSKVVGWGEIGLDYHWETVDRSLQQQVFEEQIACAREINLPIVIHCRDAYSDVLDTIERLDYSNAVLHCFTGTLAEAQRAIDLGLYLGVGGIATFKSSEDLRTTLQSLGLDRIIIETDCPYLAPQKWRGKRNEPSYIIAVAEGLSRLLELDYEAIAQATTENAVSLFGAMQQQYLVNG